MAYTKKPQTPPPSPLLLELARIPLTHEQQQAVFAFAATMGNMNRTAGLVPAMGGALALPGDIEALGIARQELQPLVDEFLENQKARGRAEGTLRSYRLALGRLVSICPLLPVTAAHVREAITRPARKDGPLLKQSTVRLRFALIRCFLAEMEEKGHLMSPCWEIGQVDGGDVEIRILSLDEMKMVYAAAMAGAPQRKHRELMERNGLMILFMMECGPRASDIAMMRARDVSDGWVRLRAKTKAQWVPVAREITDALKAQIRGDVVWPDQDGKPLQYQGVDYVVSVAQERAGISAERMGVHLMRHSFATNYLRKGGGVFQLQRILRHRTLTMTRRYVQLAGVDVKLDQDRVSLTRAMGLLGDAT